MLCKMCIYFVVFHSSLTEEGEYGVSNDSSGTVSIHGIVWRGYEVNIGPTLAVVVVFIICLHYDNKERKKKKNVHTVYLLHIKEINLRDIKNSCEIREIRKREDTEPIKITGKRLTVEVINGATCTVYRGTDLCNSLDNKYFNEIDSHEKDVKICGKFKEYKAILETKYFEKTDDSVKQEHFCSSVDDSKLYFDTGKDLPDTSKSCEPCWNQSSLRKGRYKPTRILNTPVKFELRNPLRKKLHLDFSAGITNREVLHQLFAHTLQTLAVKGYFRKPSGHVLPPLTIPFDVHKLHSHLVDMDEARWFNVAMSNHFERMATFANWPISAPVSALRMVDAGFYINMQTAKVNCFSCGFEIGSMLELTEYIENERRRNDGPGLLLRMHNRIPPDCKFALDEARRNGYEALTEVRSASSPDAGLSNAFSNMNIMSNKPTNGHNGAIGENASRDVVEGNYSSQNLLSATSTPNIISSIPNNRGQSVMDHPVIKNAIPNIDRGMPVSTIDTMNRNPIQRIDRGISTIDSGHVMFNGPNSIIQNDTANNSRLDSGLLSGSFSSHPEDSYRNSMLTQMGYSGASLTASTQNIATEGAGALPSATYEEKYDYSLKHPQYDNLPARIESFRNWPWDEKQNYRNLIPAGFFYTGICTITYLLYISYPPANEIVIEYTGFSLKLFLQFNCSTFSPTIMTFFAQGP